MGSADYQEIANAIASLGVLVDHREWAALKELFTEAVDVDYTSLFGGEPEVIHRDQLIGTWEAFLPQFSATEHVIGVPAISVSGNAARARAPVVAWHFTGDALHEKSKKWIVGGHYNIGLESGASGWQISSLKLEAVWQEGSPPAAS
jgi:SnoaL-like domain